MDRNNKESIERLYNYWKTNNIFDELTHDELSKIDIVSQFDEVYDRFYREIDFGTGGLRGIMGAGTNRINKYTVGRVTVGLSRFLLDNCFDAKRRGVVIGYDTRMNSRLYADIASNIFSSFDIPVYIQKSPRPVSQLSYSVSSLNCVAGVMITASHNPKEYNGYKIYDENGCQLVPDKVERLVPYINKITDYSFIRYVPKIDLIKTIDNTDSFIDAVRCQKRLDDKNIKANLSIVYTPLHGTGLFPVTSMLSQEGFINVHVVREQTTEDGYFSTVVSPNPEDKAALELGIQLAKSVNADIVLGTDPDCDRVGVAVKKDNDYVLLTGNQIGALLMDYLLETTDYISKRYAVIKTIVTSELGAIIARSKGLKVFETLTGFKYIGEMIGKFEKAKLDEDNSASYNFLYGYEESYGYLVGKHARDKDAVVSILLISEMAAKAKDNRKTLVDMLSDIYKKYGYFYDKLDSYVLKGEEGKNRIDNIMNILRNNKLPFKDVECVIDYLKGDTSKTFEELPKANVLKIYFEDQSWFAIRPSGTEPKIKLYYSIKGNTKKEAERRYKDIKESLQKYLGLEE